MFSFLQLCFTLQLGEFDQKNPIIMNNKFATTKKKKKKREKKTDLFQSAIFAKNNYQKKFITLEKQINTSADKHNKNKISRHLIVSKSSKANISPHCLVTNVFEFKINSQVIFPLYARGKPRGNKVSCTLILFL